MIIGLSGLKGSGKDTVAKIFEEHGYKSYSFANSLKDVLSSLFLWDRKLLEGDTTDSREWREIPDLWWEDKLSWDISKNRLTPRFAMTHFGTDIIRKHFSDDMWILRLEREIKDLDNVIIKDCRYPNEIEMVRRMNGKMIKIMRHIPEWSINIHNMKNPEDYMKKLGIHSSEWQWMFSEYDFEIDNSRNLEHTRHQINEIIAKS